ncbi:hypothetical protein H6F77_04410 [Microcoleus sp. FACHB-831]|uniref:hypothetical protein n=1 Tax=Microcoleus sp. FACHB-831 TaxID=2692827 RepID=UPI0016852466|nr:hypothetical protein [Microcoleus sp. FACHB-831]MBD1920361.1 hypothetical protein [Microcoleus sp. FACHB-831]
MKEAQKKRDRSFLPDANLMLKPKIFDRKSPQPVLGYATALTVDNEASRLIKLVWYWFSEV